MKFWLKNCLLAVAGVSAALTAARPARAVPTFDFTQCAVGTTGQVENSACDNSSYSNASSPFSQTVGGVTVTATALATTGTTNSNDKNLNATSHVGQYGGYGLGVCSSGDTSCSDPQHQIDNNRSYEFILFTFSTPVSLSQVSLANFGGLNSNGTFNTSYGGGDMDFSYWTGVSTASTTISNLASPGSGWSAQTNVACTGTNESTGCGTTAANGQVVTSDGLSGTNVTYLLIGAGYDAMSGCTSGATCGNTDGAADFFKIQSLTLNGVTTTQVTTPEPGTIPLLLTALAGLWMWRRRSCRRCF